MGTKRPAEVYTREEIGALLRACGRGPCGVRLRALIVLLWRSGLRISEALALRPADLDPRAGTIRVLHGKGDRARTVALDPEAFDAIAIWQTMRSRRAIGGPRSVLFCTLRGAAISPTYVRAALKRTAARAGILKRVHPHGLRHTHAVELEREGVRPSAIQRQLGHADLSITTRYLDHISAFDVVEAIRSRKTWSKKKDGNEKGST